MNSFRNVFKSRSKFVVKNYIFLQLFFLKFLLFYPRIRFIRCPHKFRPRLQEHLQHRRRNRRPRRRHLGLLGARERRWRQPDHRQPSPRPKCTDPRGHRTQLVRRAIGPIQPRSLRRRTAVAAVATKNWGPFCGRPSKVIQQYRIAIPKFGFVRRGRSPPGRDDFYYLFLKFWKKIPILSKVLLKNFITKKVSRI